MALSAATRLLEPCRAPVQGSLLLLLLPLGLGWTQPPRAAETGQGRPGRQEPGLLDLAGVRDPVSLAPGLSGFSCVEASRLSARQVLELLVRARQNSALRVDQLRCLASRLSQHLAPRDLDALPFLNPPSRWSVSTLEALRGLLAKLDPPIVRSIPQRSSRHPSWRRLEPDARLPRFRRDTEKACPPGQEPEVVDENLFWYEDRELEACVEGAMLAEQMDNVNRVPFTYQQLSIFKRKLDQTFPQGYPESLVQKLGPFFRYVLPEDINKWNVTSLGTVKDLLQASRGHSTDAQVMALLTRYLLGRGDLDKDTLDFLAGVPPTYLCVLSSRQLESLPLSILWTVTPKDLDSCSPRQLGLLYPKAHLAFQNVSGQEYLGKIKPFLGGAFTEDLRALGHQNVSMDLATFKQLRVESVVPLTVAEVQRLLGPNVADLKGEESSRPVRDWIFHQRQEDLDQLGLGLQGGVPNGYLILDLGFREAFTGGAPRPRPGLGLAWISTPLLIFMLS